MWTRGPVEKLVVGFMVRTAATDMRDRAASGEPVLTTLLAFS
jgi:hypothetical protein